MAGLHFEVTADNNDFLRKMQGVRSAVANASSGVEKESERMDAAFRRLAASVGAIFTAQQAARIIENIVRVRGEFQQLEVAFTTMLRSGEKADKLMAEAVDFAAHTPFDLQGVADGIRQLLAYGTAAEDAIKEVEMLGNVAAGLSVPLNDMIYLYGTLRSQGRAYTVDIRQFAGRGVPIYEELSKVLGVTVEQVNEFISAGKVGFAEVEQAFKNMTSEGGMFHNLMQEQSKTITGQISNLKDNIDMMFNEMGQNAEGFISDVISGASYLVEHYKDVLRVLGTLVAMYGSYRATLMLVAAAQKATVAAGNVRAWLSLAKGIRTAKDAVTALNLAVKANPLGLIVSAVAGLIAAISSWVSKQREAREEIEAAVKPLQDEYRQVNELANKLKDSNLKEEERKKVLTELKELAPDVVAGIEDEADSLELLNDRLEDFNNAKLAEIAVKRFSMEGGFSETVEELDEAKGKLQQEEADLVNIYADIYARYSENRSKVGDFWRQQMDDILNSADSVTEKVRKIYGVDWFAGYSENELGTSKELDRRQKDRWFILGDNFGIGDYNKALSEYEEAEDEYAEHAESLSKRIRAVAESMFPDDIGERESLISKLLAAYGLGGDPGNTEPIGPQPRILPKDFDRQVEEAKAEVERARKELSDLMKGILPENAAADFDFASAMEEAAKKLKEAEGKYSTLTGYDPKAAEKAADDRAKAEEKAAAELAEVRARIEDEEYELKKASTTDRIQLLELEKQHALEALQEELEAAKLVYEALGKDTAELEAAYARLSELAGKRYDIEISNERDEQTENAAAELQSLLSQYQDYAAKRKAIEEQYNEDIRKLQKARTDENAAEIDAAIAEARKQQQESIAQLELDNLYDSSQWVNFFDNIKSLSKNTATELYQILHEQLQALLDANKISIDDYVRVQSEMSEQLRSKLSDTGYFGSYQSGGIDSLLGNVFETGKSAGGAKGADMMSFASKAQGAVAMVDMIIKAVHQTIQAIKGITDEVNDMMASFGEDVDIETSRGKWTEFANLFAEFDEHAYNGWENLKNGNIAGAIQETVASITSLIANINRWKDKLKEARIEDLEEQIESLGDAYDDLQKKADKAYSTVQARMITQSNENLQRQIELIDEKIKEEQSKKDTDDERIEGWRDEQEQLREEIEANAEAAQEAINGISFDSFRSGFLDLMMDFESGSEDFADSFNEHLQRAIYDSLLAEKYQSAIRELYDKFSEYGEDGLTEEEVEELRDMYSELADDLIEERDKINEAFGFDDFDREGSSKGVAQASQESIDYLNGLMTNVNDNVFSLSENVKALAGYNKRMLLITTQIEANTRPIADIHGIVGEIYSEVVAIRRTSDTQETRGIKIR